MLMFKKGTEEQKNMWGEIRSVFRTHLYTWTAAKLAAGIQTQSDFTGEFFSSRTWQKYFT